MSRESIVAIIIGFGIGLLVALGVLFGPRLLKSLDLKLPFLKDSQDTQIRLDVDKNSDSKNDKVIQKLVIDNPIDGGVFVQKNADVLVKGKTEPGANVVGLSMVNQAQSTANKEGVFELELELLEGKNIIQVVSYSDKTHAAELTIYYAKD
ncbi:MAG: hypothetical protein Q8Q65_04645 [bacterium]|nr:hypothetical protein [bacterium]